MGWLCLVTKTSTFGEETTHAAFYAWWLWSIKHCNPLLLDCFLKWNVRSCLRNALCFEQCWLIDRLSDTLSCGVTSTCRKQHVLLLFFNDRMGADLHQVIRLFLICMLYIMHATYFTTCILNNPLHSENCVCWLFSSPKIARGKCSSIYICNHTMLMLNLLV